MTTLWVEKNSVWHLECQEVGHTDMVACVHTVDAMMSSSSDELAPPSGSVSLPMAGEFPYYVAGTPLNAQLTTERLGSFKVKISDTINAYGTRKISILSNHANPIFLMTLNPEDAIVSIYRAVDTFVNTQVVYTGGDKFGSCRGPNHTMGAQKELDFLTRVVKTYPMLEFWDKLSKVTTKSCVVCMWRRHEPVTMPDANASGLGSL